MSSGNVRIDDVNIISYIHCVDNIEATMPHHEDGDRVLRDVTINLRAKRGQRALIDKAAAALGKNRSDFMLEAACREAESVLLDRRYLALDEATFRRFMDELDRPPAANARLRGTLSTKAPWEV